MKKAKQVLSILLAVLMIALSVPGVFAKDEAPIGGQCGENAFWTLDTETRTLTVSGTGDMYGVDATIDDVNNSPTPQQYMIFSQIEELVYSKYFLDILHEAGYSYSTIEEAKEAEENGEWSSDVILTDENRMELFNKIDQAYPISIVIEEGITGIGVAAFIYDDYIAVPNPHLQSVSLPSTLQTIGDYAFANNMHLRNIVIPSSVKKIGAFAFGECFSLQNINVPDSIEYISTGAFYGIPMSTIVLPESCGYVGDQAFSICGENENTLSEEKNIYILNDSLAAPIASIPVYSGNISEDELKECMDLLYEIAMKDVIELCLTVDLQLDILTLPYQTFCNSYPELYITENEFLEAVRMKDELSTFLEYYYAEIVHIVGATESHSTFASIEEMKDAFHDLYPVIFEKINRAFDTSITELKEIATIVSKASENEGEYTTELQYTEVGEAILQKAEEYQAYVDGFDFQIEKIVLGETLDGYKGLPWVVIHANPGSVAHQMAMASGVKFECLNHAYSSEITKPATCQEEGIRTFTCPDCGKTYTEAIEKTAHTPGAAVKENETAATTEHGGSYDEVVRCTVCNTELSRTQKTTDPLPKPSEPGDSNQGNNDQNQDSGKKLNFFQRIIEWFRNLFQRLTSIFRR